VILKLSYQSSKASGVWTVLFVYTVACDVSDLRHLCHSEDAEEEPGNQLTQVQLTACRVQSKIHQSQPNIYTLF